MIDNGSTTLAYDEGCVETGYRIDISGNMPRDGPDHPRMRCGSGSRRKTFNYFRKLTKTKKVKRKAKGRSLNVDPFADCGPDFPYR